jgi:antitoxin (DNA-binding transcriptional repressor) of toxin-antitoxin stability system
MQTISKSQFKPKALEIMRQIEKTGQSIIITDHGRPSLELRPYIADQIKQEPMDYLKGSVLDYVDPTEPVGSEDWEASD